jgi:quercetin dioxygenase-like cupin family protein
MEPKVLTPGSGQAINVLGDSQTIRLTGEDTGGLFALIEQSNPAGVGVPMHVHANEDELFHVVEGTMEFTTQGKTHVATAGTTVYLPRNIPHSFVTVGDVPVKTLLQVFPAGAEKMFFELNNLPAGPPDMEKVIEICGRYGVTFL